MSDVRAPIEASVREFSALKREPSLAMRVSEQILESIASGQLQAGLVLASERELGAQFGVSRTVIREAIRGLEARGVLKVASGRPAEVTAVSADHVSETLELYIRRAQSQDIIRPHDIAEVRATLEMRLVELACTRASDEDLANIQSACDKMEEGGSVEHAAACDADFHRQIAISTHNALFVTLLDSINAALVSIRIQSLTLNGRPQRALAQHRQVLNALKARDIKAATQAIAVHLEDSRRYYSEVLTVVG